MAAGMSDDNKEQSTTNEQPTTGDALAPALTPADQTEARLLGDLRTLIEGARERVAATVNQELTLLYWDIGRRIHTDILAQQRAEYGKQVVAALARHLTQEFGRGFTRDNLLRMVQFVEAFPDRRIVGTLSRQLGWSHFVELLPLKQPLEREFYAQMAVQERWSVRTLEARIQGMLYERTALSKNTDELVRQELALLRDEDRLTPDLVFRDPYLLGFLGLADAYSERDLEAAIVREMEAFLLELGAGFAFVARQKRMVIDGKDFALDLLFYHRDLCRLVAIELKIGEFKPGYKGQMELYLRWLDKYERRSGEEAPVGLILCSAAGPEQVALLQLDQGDIRVAQYLTDTLPQPVLEQRLRAAVRRGREQIVADVARTHDPNPPDSAALPSERDERDNEDAEDERENRP